MTISDAILTTIAASPGRTVAGRTVLQKKLYFLSVLLGEDFGYFPHYYGPYSPLVTDSLGALVEAGLVREESQILAGLENEFGEARRYCYSLGDSASDVLKDIEPQAMKYRAALDRVNAHTITSDPKLLAAAAKVHFILAERGPATADQIRERARQLGWNLTDGQIRQVVEYLQCLGLVRSG